VAVDVIAVFENESQDYLSLSTSSIENDWIFDNNKVDEYFMNKVVDRFDGEAKGLRYKAFSIEFEGGQWIRVFIHNAPLRNFEIDLVTVDSEKDLSAEINRIFQTVQI
jgi:hypothetical protein